MRKISSVLLLLARTKVYKLLLILGGMCTVSFCGFYLGSFYKAWAFGENEGDIFLAGCYIVAFGLCTLAVIETSSKKSNTSILWRRLAITERTVFWLDALLNSLCFWLLWMTEIVLLYGLMLFYQRFGVDPQEARETWMAFYRKDFFHGILPLAETGLWIRNALCVAVYGIICAYISLMGRYKKKSAVIPVWALIMSVFRLGKGVGEELYLFTAFLVVLAALCSIAAMVCAHNGKRIEDEKKT